MAPEADCAAIVRRRSRIFPSCRRSSRTSHRPSGGCGRGSTGIRVTAFLRPRNCSPARDRSPSSRPRPAGSQPSHAGANRTSSLAGATDARHAFDALHRAVFLAAGVDDCDGAVRIARVIRRSRRGRTCARSSSGTGRFRATLRRSARGRVEARPAAGRPPGPASLRRMRAPASGQAQHHACHHDGRRWIPTAYAPHLSISCAARVQLARPRRHGKLL